MIARTLTRLAHVIPPETAHRLAIEALRADVFPAPSPVSHPGLVTEALGLSFPNPVGVSAGFDKNGEVFAPLLQRGFGFVEIGTVTPLAQAGNPKPRIWRLPEAEAVINRLGFNNEGADAMEARLPPHRGALPGIVGINIGKNKDTVDALADYLPLLRRFYSRASYITANISSPNTAGLRDLQKREHFEAFTHALRAERDGLAAVQGVRVPLLIKIAPDVSDAELEAIVEVAVHERIDGLIVSNTTISRPDGLRSPHAKEQGGLSGRPLMTLSTEALRKTAKLAGGELTLIGVGGIHSASDVIAKIRAGASLVQLYTAMVYQGFGLAQKINGDLAAWLDKVGVKNLSDLRGMDVR
jgi:dihydroorotate dehydrogenase